MTAANLKETIEAQRTMLAGVLHSTMRRLARTTAGVLDDRSAIEALLRSALPTMSFCKHLFVLDATGRQIVDNITREGSDSAYFGRDRSERPYLQGVLESGDFRLSEAYISRNRKRPMLTAIQVIRDESGALRGFLGADYDLHELPGTRQLYEEPQEWRQIKGDPAIREGLFRQTRVTSLLDDQLDIVLPLMNELMTEHGVFHGKLHFSSSRATIWLVDDPFVYRILTIEELIHPDICLAYPHRPYIGRAVVPREHIAPVFSMFRELRFADDNIYLRAGSLNLCNGMVVLNFSCDGSHYLRYEEFLDRGLDFWFGQAG